MMTAEGLSRAILFDEFRIDWRFYTASTPKQKIEASRANDSARPETASPDVVRQVYDLARANGASCYGARACVFKMG